MQLRYIHPILRCFGKFSASTRKIEQRAYQSIEANKEWLAWATSYQEWYVGAFGDKILKEHE
jgi:hypothetical protein